MVDVAPMADLAIQEQETGYPLITATTGQDIFIYLRLRPVLELATG